MSFTLLIVCIVLIISSIVFFFKAFGNKGGVTMGNDNYRYHRLKMVSIGVMFTLFSILLFVFGFMPRIVEERLVEAEGITRSTFLEKRGKEPDKVSFDSNNLSGWGDGWKYKGTAQFDGELWNVTVTRSNDNIGKKTHLQFEAELQK